MVRNQRKHKKDTIFFEKEYFGILENECSLGFVTKSEMICKENNSSDCSSKDSFVPPFSESSHDSQDSSFVPPVGDNMDARSEMLGKTTKDDEQQVLLLFVKADSGSSIITSLKSEMKLSSKYSDDLYLETMNLWAGTQDQFEEEIISDFSLAESKGDIPKLDFVIMQIKLCDKFQGYQIEASSAERMEFFKHICEKGCPIVRISNRLNFGNSRGASMSWEK